MISRLSQAVAVAAALLTTTASAQTWTNCNPLESTCDADTALGIAINVDFTKGEVNSFIASGGTPEYGSDGASFTVASSGDAPQLISLFYIMFGRVELTMKAAPGKGIVSSLVLQSDDLDEIDMEWLGADDSEVQTNYFGKGQTTTYNRGQFNPAANNQGEFITYTIDWTKDEIVWSVGSTVVRTLTVDDAEENQYPQTPMQVRFGSWAGGDPSTNAAGTVEWARGPTDYSDGPFSMVVKSIAVTDYSTGTKYKYGDNSGAWTSIEAVDGEVNGNVGQDVPTMTATVAAATSLSPSIPAGGIGSGNTATQTGWPWEATSTADTGAIPDGWRITPSGKIVPIQSSASSYQASSSSPAPSLSASSPPSQGAGFEAMTTFNDQDLFTTVTVPVSWSAMGKSFDSQGFPVTPTADSTPAAEYGGTDPAPAPAVARADLPSSKATSASRHAALLAPIAIGAVFWCQCRLFPLFP